MTTNFPTSLDTFTNPAASDTLSGVPHHTQHDNDNDAIAALEAKVGVDSSAVTTSLDYKVANKASVGSNAPTTSAVGDSGAVGTGTNAARDDHKHGREAFATNAVLLGTAAVAGVATTLMRSDDTIAAFDATVPVTQAFGDIAAAGSVAKAAHRDHKHGMPAAPTAHTHDGAGSTSTIVGGVAEAGTGLPVASGTSDMAIGDFASSTGTHSIVIGGGSEAQGTGHTSAAKSTGDRCVVIGPNASSVVAEAVVIGRSANATTGDQGVAIGRDAAVKADGVAVGVGASASATSCVSVGGSASSTVQFAIAFGNSASATADSATAIGAAAAASGAQSVALGGSRFTNGHAIASAGGAVAIGSNTANAAGPTASNTSAIAMGSGDGTVVGAVASAAHSQAYGGGASAAHATAVALGKSAATTKANQIVLGTSSEVVTLPGGVEHRVQVKTNTDYTLTGQDYAVMFSTGNTARVATLPAVVAGNVGLTYVIKKTDAGTGTVTVTADTSGTADLIDGAATKVLTNQYDVIMLIASAVDAWSIIKGPGAP